MDQVDVCIVGAGVIGLAIAQRLCVHKSFRQRTVVLLDQEEGFGQQISSRNSEVIHAGIYYSPGSLKARLCLQGKNLLYSHCEQYQIPHRKIGKFIVARDMETEQLESLFQRAEENGVSDLQRFSQYELRKAEPAVTADMALFSPSTGIIDSHAYMLSLLHLAQSNGCHFTPLTQVTGIEPDANGFIVSTTLGRPSVQQAYRFHCRKLINCAGLGATQLAAKIQNFPAHAIPAFYLCKGDYFSYAGASPFRHLIYPIPEDKTRGLGIHSTLDMAGQLRFGPDANYVQTSNYDVDANKAMAYASAIKRYFPDLDASRLAPAYSGIRPKLAGPDQDPMDFVIGQGQDWGLPGLIQLFGIESPGLTCSLALADHLLTLPDLLEN